VVWVCRVCGGGGVWHLKVNDDEREVLEGQHDVIFFGFGAAESSRAAADCRLLLLSVSSLVKNIHFTAFRTGRKTFLRLNICNSKGSNNAPAVLLHEGKRKAMPAVCISKRRRAGSKAKQKAENEKLPSTGSSSRRPGTSPHSTTQWYVRLSSSSFLPLVIPPHQA